MVYVTAESRAISVEKIKRALERAKQQQANHRNVAVTTVPASDDSAVSQSSPIAHNVEDIHYRQTRVLQIDPEVLRRNNIIVGDASQAAADTAYKILRTQVEQRLDARGWNAVAVTSPGASAGKTITAINLSVALAKEVHRTVLLVDLDFRNPNIHKRFEYDVQKGLINYLLDDVPVNEILINPGIERLVLLPAGRVPVPNSSELLSSPKMVRLVDELKSRYPSRIIVFDMPPLLWSDDTMAFTPYVDTTLLVVAEGLTTKEELRRATEIMEGHDLIGTVLNRSKEIQPTYYIR